MSRSLEDVENIDRDKRRQFDKETKDYLNTKLSELKLNLHDMRSKIEIKSYFWNKILFLGEKLGISQKIWI